MKKTTIAGAGACAFADQDENQGKPMDDDSSGFSGYPGQPAREENIARIVSYFESGITNEPGKLGIELEHTIVRDKGLEPVSYSQDKGILWLLRELKRDYPITTCDEQGDLLGLARKGDGITEAITLEPAAQLELSAGPFSGLGEANECFNEFERLLHNRLSAVGQKALLVGYHPSAQAADLELIPKRRYKFMDLYLGERGPYGISMMRGSASTQISIDYCSVDDCLRKLRLAFALTPIIYLVCDNSPVFEGEARPHKLVRAKIWQECDPDRCGLVPGVMDAGFSFRSYAEYVLDTPAILVPCKNHEWCYSEKTFGELYAEEPLGQQELEHALSMFFNDVRLKTYIEIRPADSMPVPYVMAYAALIKGLFYSEQGLDAMDELFDGVGADDIEAAKNALMEQGYEAEIYGRPVAQLADALMETAQSGLNVHDRMPLRPLEDLVRRRMTLADLADR